jgi:hypothetical protein
MLRLQQPHYIDWMNCLRTACYGIWFYSCLLLCALVFNSKGVTYYLHHGGRHVTHELEHYEEVFHKTYHIEGHAEYYGIGHEYKVVVWSTWAFQQRVTNVAPRSPCMRCRPTSASFEALLLMC